MVVKLKESGIFYEWQTASGKPPKAVLAILNKYINWDEKMT